jgi:hypothetical protein
LEDVAGATSVKYPKACFCSTSSTSCFSTLYRGASYGSTSDELLPPCQDSDSQAWRIEYCTDSSHSSKSTAHEDKKTRPRCVEPTPRGDAECPSSEPTTNILWTRRVTDDVAGSGSSHSRPSRYSFPVTISRDNFILIYIAHTSSTSPRRVLGPPAIPYGRLPTSAAKARTFTSSSGSTTISFESPPITNSYTITTSLPTSSACSRSLLLNRSATIPSPCDIDIGDP